MNLLAGFAPALGPEWTALAASALVQITGVVLVAALVARAGCRRHAAARHALWLGVLLWVLASPGIAAILHRAGYTFGPIALRLPGVVDVAIPAPAAGPGMVAGAEPEPSPARHHDHLPRTSSTPPPPLRRVPRVEPSVVTVAPPLTPPWPTIRGALAIVWATGVLIALARIAWGGRRVAAMCRAARPLDASRHGAALAGARAALGITRLPLVVTSQQAAGPLAVGVLRPRVVLPTGLAEALEPDALRDVLIHECAHLLRRDLWVGLLQRLAAALFWPHPFVYYLNAQLSRAREEVCDNFVIRRGDACGYARTLVALTELCRPRGLHPAGLGLLRGVRWTLAERVAGLLDPGRIAMTRPTLRTSSPLVVLLALTGLMTASLRLGGPLRADEPALAQAAKAQPASRPEEASDGAWSLAGVAVDEQDRPVAGAVIRLTRATAEAEAEVRLGTTAADGTFSLRFDRRQLMVLGLVVEADDGARAGLVRFDPGEVTWKSPPKEPLRIVVKPVRPLTVHVKDVQGAPIAGAAVEAVELGYQTGSTTGPDGTAHLRVAADARIEWVVGVKPGAGFDYYENYHSRPPADFPPLPAELTLTLDGARTFRIKAVDSRGRSLPGIRFAPFQLGKPGKINPARTMLIPDCWVSSDEQGIALLDWLPKDDGLFQVEVRSKAYAAVDEVLRHQPGGPAELTARLLHATRLSGTARLPDGQPARGVLVGAFGSGDSTNLRGGRAWTAADGSYTLDVAPEMAYMVGVIDDAWTAPVHANVVLHEDQPQGGLDFALSQGTRLHGQVTRKPADAPVPGVWVTLVEQGPVLPKAYRRGRDNAEFSRPTTTDAQGRYQFRAAPGRYTLRLLADEIVTTEVEVKDGSEVIRDLSLAEPAQDGFVTGIVVEKTLGAERPVPRALIFALSLGYYGGPPSKADEAGRFRAHGRPNMVLYAQGAGADRQTLAGFTPVADSAREVKLVLAPAAKVTGRVVDSGGQPLANRQVMVQIDLGSVPAKSAHHRMGTYTNEQGRFTFPYPVGTEGEIGVFHQTTGRPNGVRTVVSFTVPTLETVELTDLIVPADWTKPGPSLEPIPAATPR